MKKYKFKINGSDYEVDIKEASDNLIHLEVNGSPFEVEMEPEEKPVATPVAARPAPITTPKVDHPRPGSAAKKVTSPLPGLIHSVLVKEGDAVKMGDTLVILEAMKMENSIVAEFPGTVSSIKVSTGTSVMQGDLLLEIA